MDKGMEKQVKEFLYNLLKDQLEIREDKVYNDKGELVKKYVLRIKPQPKEYDMRNDIRVFPQALEYEITETQFYLIRNYLKMKEVENLNRLGGNA